MKAKGLPKKLLALSLTAAMTLSMAACGGKDASEPSNADTTNTEAPAAENTAASETTPSDNTAPAEEASGDVSIDFEDGVYGFAGVDKSVSAASDDATISVADFNGSKALKVESGGKALYIGIQLDALLGGKAADVKTVEMSIGVENPDGKFHAVSGKIYAFLGTENQRKDGEWSVYLETANPKTVSYEVPDGMTFGEGNYIVVSLETDTGKDAGEAPAIMYLDNIAFKDASGNVLEADTSAKFAGVSDSGSDHSNLCGLTGAVEFEGFTAKADGWAQAGATMTDEILAALVPGSVVEISYSSENGDMWIVMNEAEAGWMRVGDGNNGSSFVNNGRNTAQIPFEMIAEYCGDDVSKWGTSMQCEASGAWEVFSVKVGQKAPNYTITNAVEFEGFATKGDGWAQAGFAMTDEILAALVPGSMVEVSYSSENGDMWLVMNEAEAGWMRVGDGNNGQAITDGSKAYIPFEMIAEYCGDDVSTWGTTMQCEASGAWEVYSVRVGTAQEFAMVNDLVEFEGFETKGDGWAQAGFAMTDEIIAALVPGSVVTISYTSENGDMWLVMNEAAAGWMRVGDGNNGQAVYNGSTCQIPFEMIAEYCGDDVSTWGTTMQCEASGAWEVYSVSVGMAAE